jgi:hypothetical protein
MKSDKTSDFAVFSADRRWAALRDARDEAEELITSRTAESLEELEQRVESTAMRKTGSSVSI